jgi:ankyrin repeat protein
LFLNWISERYIQQAQWRNDGLALLAENGDLEGVKYLVERCRANVNAGKAFPLKEASKGGHLQVVKYLVECGANVHVRDDEALRCATQNGHLEVVKYLVLQGGADVHACDYGGCSAVQWASWDDCHSAMAKFLVSKGAKK